MSCSYLIAPNYYKHLNIKTFSVLKGVPEKCVECGATEELTIDHILPRSTNPKARGLLANYRILCRRCNMIKGNLKICLLKSKQTRSCFEKQGAAQLRCETN